jgi:hypothetical protein
MLASGVFAGEVASAQTLPSGAFIVQPAKKELSLFPGEEKTIPFLLKNGTPVPLHIKVSFQDVVPSAQTSPFDDPVVLVDEAGAASTYALKETLTVLPSSFDLLSGTDREVPVTIRVPRTSLPGGLYGSVVFEFSPVSSALPASANVAVTSRVAALLYVRVLGDTKEEGELAAFGLFNNAKTTLPPSGESPLRFQVAFTNTGAVHLNPYGRMTIRPRVSFVGKPQTLIIDPWAVLPGATRMREVALTTPLFPGYYRAHLEQNRGYQDIVDVREIGFWVLPTPKGWLAIIILLCFGFFVIRRSLRLSRNFVS